MGDYTPYTPITDARVASSGRASSYGILGLIGFVCALAGGVGIFAGSRGLEKIFSFFFGGRWIEKEKY